MLIIFLIGFIMVTTMLLVIFYNLVEKFMKFRKLYYWIISGSIVSFIMYLWIVSAVKNLLTPMP